MAHHIKVKEIPHLNKDGSESKTKKDYRIVDRHRGKRIVVGVVPSRAKVEEVIKKYRATLNPTKRG